MPVELAGRKYDGGKVPYHLVKWPFIAGLATVLGYGAAKYGPGNWENLPNARPRYFAATLRHLIAWWLGEELDPESGLPHLHHVACNVMFLDTLNRT